jgi:AGZA family xanthine/uracil permease-like MFS transporter
MMIKKINGSMLIGILIITFLGFILGVSPLPEKWVSMPPDISPIVFKLDILGALSWGFFAVILTVFVMDFVDTMGTLLGVSLKAGLLDENGNLPEIEKPFLCDSLATVVGSLLGTTTCGAYIESAAGIEAGGRSGLTAVVTAFLFLIALFFAPFFTAIPSYAYGSALIIVGVLMMSPISKIKFDDLSDVIPVFVTVALMSFTYNLGIGMTAGFVVYPLTRLITGRVKEVNAGMWILFGFSVLFFIFYPY